MIGYEVIQDIYLYIRRQWENFSFTITMQEYLKQQCPTWADKTYLEFDLMVGDDSDSLISCNLLEEMTSGKWNTNYFYNFESFYRVKNTENHVIGVDMAFTKNVMCFDNHVSRQYSNSKFNPYCMNLNLYKGINANDNYYKKYPFSTLMMIMSYYDIPLPAGEIGKEIILAIDSAFKGHYTPNEYFKKIHTDWLEALGFSSLIDTLKKRDKKYFNAIQEQYGLNEKIFIDDEGYLQTDILLKAIQPHIEWKIELPEQQFKLKKACIREAHKLGAKEIPDRKKLNSLAFTGKDYVSYTYSK